MDIKKNCSELNESVQSSSDTELNEIKETILKLLSDTYLVKDKISDSYFYNIAITNQKIIRDYFSMMDIDLILKEGLIYIKADNGGLRYRLSKLETVLLFILKLIDIDSMIDLTGSEPHLTTVQSIKNKLEASGVYPVGKPQKTEFIQALIRLKRMKFIDFKGSNSYSIDDDQIVNIYPTINEIINGDSTEIILASLSNYKKKDESDDEESGLEDNEDEKTSED
jgi:hypothetical protein